MSAQIEDPFLKAFRGRFRGVLRWPQLDVLWEVLDKDAASGWYIYAVGEQPPSSPANGAEFKTFLREIDALLRREHKESHCGIVYVDDFNQPAFVKIFDPNNLGVSCGFSDNPPLPGWILSKLPPCALQSALSQTQSRKRWWQRIFSH
jgi:hypothetical protein